jgi:hypothetical protein
MFNSLNIDAVSRPFRMMRLYRTSQRLYQVRFKTPYPAAITVCERGIIYAIVFP